MAVLDVSKVNFSNVWFVKMEEEHKPQVKELLENYLSFKEIRDHELDKDVFSNDDVQIVCTYRKKVIGYIRAKSYNKEFARTGQGLYFKEDYDRLNLTENVYVLTHLVVVPRFRGTIVSSKLVEMIVDIATKAKEDIITLTWVQSELGKSMSKSLLVREGFKVMFYLKHFMEEFDLSCCYCGDKCRCDSEFLVRKTFTDKRRLS